MYRRYLQIASKLAGVSEKGGKQNRKVTWVQMGRGEERSAIGVIGDHTAEGSHARLQTQWRKGNCYIGDSFEIAPLI